ncbi:MAG: cation diffusion facilitator family transporter [Prevotella sp.]|nr:cation diffusion facilitator family transporter [Staphylococcus sp.]MCM1349825.1 cation diffusion facilitator family transporter [Prevotella sp.]
MQKLLVKLFIKDYQNVNDPKIRGKYGSLSGVVGIISNLLLCSIKIALGLLTASVSILADGINNLTDAGSSIITLIGFKLSSAPADDDHPYGHERIEYITGMMISFIILIIGFTLGKESVIKIIEKEAANKISYLAIGIMIFSILVKFWQSMFYKKMAKAIQSEALIASSKDSLNDCISTAAVIIGILLVKLTHWYFIDGLVGILVAVFIMISGIKMIIDTVNPLIGNMPSAEEINLMSQKIMSYPGILGIHDLVIHRYGSCTTFVTVHAEVDSQVDVVISHDVIDNIERDFKSDLNINLTIHLDPVDVNNPETIRLKELIHQLLESIDPTISMHDFRVVHGTTHTNLLFDVAIPAKYTCTPNELRELICSEVIKLDGNYYAIIQVDQLYVQNTKK